MDKFYLCNECKGPIKVTGLLSGLEKIALIESSETEFKPTIIDYKSKEKVRCIYCNEPIKL